MPYISLYHHKLKWARRWRRWRFVLVYRVAFPWAFVAAPLLLAGLVWWFWPQIAGARQSFCILHLMVYGASGPGC